MSTAPFALTPEPIAGNSLTQYLRSMTNSLGSSGAATFGAGQGTVTAGVDALQAPLQYYQSILSGNKPQMESAIAPEKSDILANYRAKRRKLASGVRGGGTNSAVAGSEFAEAGDVASLLQKLRPQAAAGEADVASKEAGIGVEESQLGNQQLFQALAGILSERGQDQDIGAFLSESALSALF